jgi:membrane associated rhomboid family serine protease
MIPLRDSVHADRWPLVTYGLIAVNVWMFLYEVALGRQLDLFLHAYGFIPARYFWLAEVAPEAWFDRHLPLFTSMFLHGGWGHLLGNMVYLWIFGDNVEDRLGPGRYLVFYVLSGVGAGLAHGYLHPTSTVPTVGASGAISGVLGAYLVLFPQARVLTLVPILFVFVDIVEIPAVLYLGLWFLMQLVSGAVAVLGGAAGGVAWWAHIGGFVLGAALAPLLRRRRELRGRQIWIERYEPW